MLPTAVTMIIALLSLEAWTRLARVPSYLVPAPSATFLRLAAKPGFYLQEGAVTLGEALAGLLLGGAIALLAGALMAHSRQLERGLYPLAILVKVTPVVAVAPLFVIWFGFGPMPKVLVAALITFFPLLANSVTGFRAVNPRLLDFLSSLHASRWEVFIKLRVPSSLPYLFAALKVTIPLSIIGGVVAEWLGADRGLGHMVFLASANIDMPGLFAAILVLAAMGIIMSVITWAVERRVLFWHESYLSEK